MVSFFSAFKQLVITLRWLWKMLQNIVRMKVMLSEFLVQKPESKSSYHLI